MDTLLDLLPLMKDLGRREAVRDCNEYRTRLFSYRDLYDGIGGVAHGLAERQGLRRGDRLLLWGENRPEWLMVFWACLMRGIQVVPLDVQSSPAFVARVQAQARARLLVHGDRVTPAGLDLPSIPCRELHHWPRRDPGSPTPIPASEIVEIIYTSGTTAEPRGVIQRHRNICANLRPLSREIQRYRPWIRPFQPLRILTLLPLSHMYGQALGSFVPLLLGGSVVFTSSLNPSLILRTVRRERVSVLVLVPALARRLQPRLQRLVVPATGPEPVRGRFAAGRRWWRHRKIHSILGWKFWALVVGGARLDPDLERFWRELGFLVVQGYGMTETSPMVAVNHPLGGRAGSVGKALRGLEVRIAPDGEILVRGESVSDEYLGSPPGGRTSPEGWFHTGDLGEVDEGGWLYYRGRREERIVTPEGLNVYPQEIEALLNAHPGIRDSVVIPLGSGGEEHLHAVLLPQRPDTSLADAVAGANRRLEPHQRLGSWSVWPEEDFPRTGTTLKVRRQQVAEALSSVGRGRPDRPGKVEQILDQVLGRCSRLAAEQRLGEDLGLSSLDRVDLLAHLEDELGLELEENDFTRLATVGELSQWLRQDGKIGSEVESPASGQTPRAPAGPPGWCRLRGMETLRRVLLDLLILPLFRRYVRVEVRGQEALGRLQPPAIFASNHVSHLDTLAILAALPTSWRARLSPAMSWDYFRSGMGLGWPRRLGRAAQYQAACAIFRAYPLSQRGDGVRRALRYSGRLMNRGGCPLLYPEGRRTPDGRLLPFQSGVGYMALRLDAPVVPVRIEGMDRIYSIHHSWPRPGLVGVSIGLPLYLGTGQDYPGATRRVEQAIRELGTGK